MIMFPLPLNTRHCIGFPGYAVSSTGEVWSCRYPSGRKGGESFGEWRKRRIHAVAPNGVPYWQVVLVKNGRPVTLHTHLLVLEAFQGPRPQGYEARHLNSSHSLARRRYCA